MAEPCTHSGRTGGRTKVRMVDITAQSDQTARQYMIRLSEDLKDPVALGRCAALRGFRRRHFTAGFSMSVRT